MYKADNFIIRDFVKQTKELDELEGLPYVFDFRHQIMSTIDSSSYQFYLNYLDQLEYFSKQNPGVKPNYLLDLGYIPLIMFPSCFIELSPKFLTMLDAKQVPYIRTAPYSFISGSTHLDVVDAWVNKLDMAKLFNIAPEQVRSKDVFRRLFING